MLRRTGRHLFTVLSALSLLLCAVIAVFCVRAHMSCNDYIEFRSVDGPDPYPPFVNGAESARWEQITRDFDAWDRKRWSVHIRANPDAIYMFGRQTFFGYPRNSFDIHFYYWWLFPATAALPIALIVKQRRKLKCDRDGLCSKCGYDLRATPNRCPECGTAVVQPS